jgi:membrane protein DedA with SNARE-associated domain
MPALRGTAGTDVMELYSLTTAHIGALPGWLQTPVWFWPLTRAVGHFVRVQQALGLFLVIFAEELGIPLPAPGDAAITYAGYLTTTGTLRLPLAYLAVIAAATTGSFCNYTICRRFGHPFVVRFGPYVGLTADRLERAERAFRRWGPWAVIIGRHIPGMRIVLSAFAGIFELPRRMFVPCVLLSSTIWAAIFLELGRALGRNSRLLFRLVPVHLLPLAFVLLGLLWATWLLYEHRWRPRAEARRRRAAEASNRVQSNKSLPSKAKSRTAKM